LDSRTFWKISVASWGELLCFGTEAEAEEWRKHKARWEQCVARKERIEFLEGAECLRCLLGNLEVDCPGCAAIQSAEKAVQQESGQ
jgi:hypothetical protein